MHLNRLLIAPFFCIVASVAVSFGVVMYPISLRVDIITFAPVSKRAELVKPESCEPDLRFDSEKAGGLRGSRLS